MAALREILKNNPTTTLNEALDASETTITVTDGSVFPSTGNFRVIVEDEIMLVTARSTNDLTVVRGYEGTAGATHADTTTISQILTADALVRYGRESVPYWDTDTPPLHTLLKDDGSALVAADFTWQNQGSATVADKHGSVVAGFVSEVGTPATAPFRQLLRTAPSAPYTYIMCFEAMLIGGSNANTGKSCLAAVFRDSVASREEIVGIAVTNIPAVIANQVSAASINPATLFGGYCPLFSRLWFKLEDDNTNLKFYMGIDGVSWSLVQTRGRTAHLTNGPNQIGFGYLAQQPTVFPTQYVRLLHWSRES